MKEDNKNGSQPQPAKVVDPMAKARQMMQQRVSDLITGKIEPPNEFAEYLIKQANQAAQGAEQAAGELARLRSQVKQLETELIKLSGIADQYIVDLQKWDRPLASSTQKKEAAPEGEKDEVTP